MEIKISEDLDWMIHDQLNDLEIFVACFFGVDALMIGRLSPSSRNKFGSKLRFSKQRPCRPAVEVAGLDPKRKIHELKITR